MRQNQLSESLRVQLAQHCGKIACNFYVQRTFATLTIGWIVVILSWLNICNTITIPTIGRNVCNLYLLWTFAKVIQHLQLYAIDRFHISWQYIILTILIKNYDLHDCRHIKLVEHICIYVCMYQEYFGTLLVNNFQCGAPWHDCW